MDQINAMALFVTAVDAGSLSAAARLRGTSLASVSRHLTALEERLGTRLLVRTTRKLALTEAGQLYHEKAKRVLADIDDMEASLTADAAEPTGRLHVCGPTLFGRVFMMPVLAKFIVRNPKIYLDIRLLDREVNLVEEGVDIAIRIGPMDDSNLIVRKLGAIRWVVTAAPAYLESRGTPTRLDDLMQHDCLVYSQQKISAEWQMLERGETRNMPVPVRMRSNTLDGVVIAAVEGAGLVYAPAWAVAHHVAAGRLQVVMQDYELPPRAVSAVFTHNRLLAGKVRAVLDFMADQFAGHDLDAGIPDASW